VLVVAVELEREGERDATFRSEFFRRLEDCRVILAKLRIDCPAGLFVFVDGVLDKQGRLLERGLRILQLDGPFFAAGVRLDLDDEVRQVDVAVFGASRATFDQRGVRQRFQANAGDTTKAGLVVNV